MLQSLLRLRKVCTFDKTLVFYRVCSHRRDTFMAKLASQ